MQNRPCIKVPVILDQDLSIFMLDHMLQSGLAETPLIFLDKKNLLETIESAKPLKTPNPPITPFDTAQTDYSLTEVMGTMTAMGFEGPIGVVIAFKNGSTLVVVGCETHYYFIDLAHGIFHYTGGPEYDIVDYAAKYGDNHPTLQFFAVNIEEPEKKPPSKKRAKKKDKDEAPAAKTEAE